MKEAVEKAVSKNSVLIDKDGLSNLYDSVLRIAGFGLGGILYTAGKKAAEKGSNLLRDNLGVEGEELIKAMALAFEAGNWGKMKVESTGEKTYKVTVTDNVLVWGLEKNKKKPVCYPLAGYIAGFFEQAFDTKAHVREVECIAKGDPACVFQVTVD